MRLRLAIPASLALLLTLTGAGAGGDVPDAAYLAPHRMVSVAPKRRLNLFCLGSGAPTVMLEAGLGGDTSVWRKVQARIASFTRTCSYDRAGYGFSTPNDRASTAENVVDDLHALVAAAKIAMPVVLVGHSAGGLYATLYADDHLNELAGMVLVDPSFAEQTGRIGAVESEEERTRARAALDGFVADLTDCAARARARADFGKLRTCGHPPKGLSPALTARFARYYATPGYYEANLAEERAFGMLDADELSQDDVEEDAAARPFAALPLVVLTSGQPIAFDYLAPETNAKVDAAWKLGHDRLAARSSMGKSVVVPGAGHFIQLDRPDAVVDAVREVVETARAKKETR